MLVSCVFVCDTRRAVRQGRSYAKYGAPADATPKKTTNERASGKAAAAADQAGSDADLAGALLIAMDTDHDGIVTKIEYREAMKALGKVHKDTKGNMTVPDKAATDPNAVQGACRI